MAVVRVSAVNHRQIFDRQWSVGTGRARHYRCTCGFQLKMTAPQRKLVKAAQEAFRVQVARHQLTGHRIAITGRPPVNVVPADSRSAQ